MRTFLLAVLFLGFVGASTTLAVMGLVPRIPALVGVLAGGPIGIWQALATIAVAVPLIFGALYAGGLLWLFLACHLFTREEIEQFMSAGPNTRLEIWVLERFSR